MPKTQPREESKDNKDGGKRQRETLTTLIGEKVIHALGHPRQLFQLQVRSLWENYYRVNVFVGADASSAQIANSYFLSADADGNILTAAPEIRKQY